MKLDDYRFKLDYEEWPEWRRFLHAWRFSIKSDGVSAVFMFPVSFIRIKLMLRRMIKDL